MRAFQLPAWGWPSDLMGVSHSAWVPPSRRAGHPGKGHCRGGAPQSSSHFLAPALGLGAWGLETCDPWTLPLNASWSGGVRVRRQQSLASVCDESSAGEETGRPRQGWTGRVVRASSAAGVGVGRLCRGQGRAAVWKSTSRLTAERGGRWGADRWAQDRFLEGWSCFVLVLEGDSALGPSLILPGAPPEDGHKPEPPRPPGPGRGSRRTWSDARRHAGCCQRPPAGCGQGA